MQPPHQLQRPGQDLVEGRVPVEEIEVLVQDVGGSDEVEDGQADILNDVVPFLDRGGIIAFARQFGLGDDRGVALDWSKAHLLGRNSGDFGGNGLLEILKYLLDRDLAITVKIGLA